MTSGVFGGLLFCNLVFPPAITDEAKIVCALVIGFGLWYLALHGERVVLQIFGVSAGMATGTFVFNIVAEFYIINAHFLILALAVVSILVATATSRGIFFVLPTCSFRLAVLLRCPPRATCRAPLDGVRLSLRDTTRRPPRP